MPFNRTCPTCAGPIAEGSPEGLCPACLVRTGLNLLGNQSPRATAATATARPTATAGLPRRFGNYELLNEIARGGMGVVYRARQDGLNRMVAVKMLLFGEFASDEFIRRFKCEASAVASLQHPNIVAIHEVGEHEGHYYFSMDLVEGQDLAQLTKDGPLPARRAARVIETIARAVDYAHRQGIIHRDLKPSNVLLDAQDEPHVSDFGLAKRLAGDSNLTATGQVLGSPHFMPPEQADPTVGSPGPPGDIYSLGALLYHLLTGRPPFVAESVESTLRQLLHHEPVSPRLLNASIPVDLETICLKCLGKEPARRYASALAVADELGRFLRNEPVHARPVGRSEKFLRWCRREPALATVALSLGLVLVTGLVATTFLLLRERAARRRADAAERVQSQLRLQMEAEKDRATLEAAKSVQLAEFLQQMLTRVGPAASLGRDTSLLRDILDQTAQRIDRDLTNQPGVMADLRDVLGRTYADIGDAGTSVSMHREALRLRKSLGTDQAADGARTMTLLARALADHDENDEAEVVNQSALALWRKLNGPADPKVANCLNNLGTIRFKRGDLAAARQYFTEALEIYRQHNDPNTSAPIHNLANIRALQKDYAGAEALYREAIALARKEHGDTHPTTALYLRNLGDTLIAQGKLDEAAAMHAQALSIRASLLDAVHPLLADSLERLGAIRLRQSHWPESAELFRQALALRKKLSPGNPDEWGDDANALANSLNARQRFDETVSALTELIDAVPPDDVRASRLHAIRGSALARNGRWSEALPDFTWAQHHEPTNAWHATLLAPLLVKMKDADAYRALCRESLNRFATADGDVACQIALLNLLAPGSGADLKSVQALADRALSTASQRGENAYYIAVKALADLRAGNPQPAVNRLNDALEELETGRLKGGRYIRIQTHAILALAHHALGNDSDATHEIHLAQTIAPSKIGIPSNGDYERWNEWLTLNILLAEAASGISSPSGTGSPTQPR